MRGSPGRVLRGVSGALGAAALAAFWAQPAHGAPEIAFVLWCAAALGWGASFGSRWERPRVGRRAAAVAGIVTLALIPRLWALADAPYVLVFDEFVEPLHGLEALRTMPWRILSGSSKYFQQPLLTPVLQAWPCLFLDPLTGSRVASVVLALVSLLSTYALAFRLFGPTAALVALTFLAGSYWHMLYSRLAHPYMQPMALVPAALYVLLAGYQSRDLLRLYLGGVLLGASVLAYTPARIAVPVSVAWLAYAALRERVPRRHVLAGAAAIGLGFFIIYSPHLHARGADEMFARLRGTAVPVQELRAAGWVTAAAGGIWLRQLQAAASPYVRPGAELAVSDPSGAPLLDRGSLVLALLGCGIAVLRLRQHGSVLVLLWIGATFVVGQMLTDIPTSAYRAAPLLPALALAAGLAVHAVGARAGRWSVCRHRAAAPLVWCVAVVLLVPPNIRALTRYMSERNASSEGGIVRYIASSSSQPVYYVVATQPLADSPIFRFLTPGQSVRNVLALMDDLGQTIDRHREAVFVIDPELADAAVAIRRCYPDATPSHERSGHPGLPVMALSVPPHILAAGRNCRAAPDAQGLRARYFSGPAWDGEVRLDHIEDFPFRFSHEPAGSVEWSGRLYIPVPGPYYFQLLQVRNPIGEAVIEGVGRIGPGDEISMELKPGFYPLTIRCSPGTPDAFCWLRWRALHAPFTTIPLQFLRAQ